MKSFKLYKTDPRPMTAKRFWAAIGLMWIFSLIFLVFPVIGWIFIFLTAITTIAGIVMILWRVMNGRPAFPDNNKSSNSD